MIAALKSSDIDRVWEITQAAEFYRPWTRESLLQEIELAPSLGLWVDQQLVAFILVRELPDQIEVSWLATAPDQQKRGLMARLLQALFNAYGHKSEVWLEVHEENLRAQKLYEKLGFVQTGKRPRYYGGVKAAILYSRELTVGR